MAVKLPQADVPRGLSGGADRWDDGPAGVILRGDFFDAHVAQWRVYWAEIEAPAAPISAWRVYWAEVELPASASVGSQTLRAWDGASWVAGTLRRWDGAAWVAAPIRRWDGSAWL